jgi:dTDP-4-amino-4,6-dideoxygalactose transaminase
VSIRLANPRLGYLAHRAEIDAAIGYVLEDGKYILGPEVDAFEKEFADFVGVEHVVSTGNGTDAIELSLRALGIGAGDFVVTTSNTAVATVAAIERAGANPFLVDIDDRRLTLSPQELDRGLRNHKEFRIKAVIAVHLYGQPAELREILEICHRHGLMLIEDCAQAHGATIEGRSVGTWGIASAFSFYPTKNLGGIGDGGAIATNDKSLAERLRKLRTYGWTERYVSEEPGTNTRLDSIQAAILRVKLGYLENENARRAQTASRYTAAFADLNLALPPRTPECKPVFHQYVVRTELRDELREHLRQHEVETGVLYPVPIHQQPAYRNRIKMAMRLSVTERAAGELLCLPVHPWLHDDEVEKIIGSVRSFFKR